MECKKTGEFKKRDCVWVRKSGLKRTNFEVQAESRVGEKSWSAKDPSAQNLQAIADRVKGFVLRCISANSARSRDRGKW